MVILLWKLIQLCNENSCNLTKLKSILHICIHIFVSRDQQTKCQPRTGNSTHFQPQKVWLETANILRKIAHPWWDSNPRPPDCMPTIHMCINAFADISLWVQWHYYIHFYANIHIKSDRHARQTPKSTFWCEVIYVINGPQNERVRWFHSLPPYFLLDFSIDQIPYIPHLVLSAESEDPWHFLSHICYTIPHLLDTLLLHTVKLRIDQINPYSYLHQHEWNQFISVCRYNCNCSVEELASVIYFINCWLRNKPYVFRWMAQIIKKAVLQNMT